MLNAAQQLAQWIESEHPGLFQHLHANVTRGIERRVLQRARLNGLGDDLSLDDLQPITVSSSLMPAIADTGSSLSDSAGNFLSTLGSGIADATSSVGSWLTSGGGLNALASLGSTYFKTQASTAQAQTNAQLQTAVLQAQVARAQAGLSPAPVSYVQGANGQTIPVYTGSVNTYPALQAAIGAGQSQFVTTPNIAGYTIPRNMVSTLGPGLSLGQIWPWALLIGGALVLSHVL